MEFDKEIGVRLGREKDEILRRWEERAKKQVPHAQGRDRLQLVDSLPAFLDELAQTFLTGCVADPKLSETGREHGVHRAALPEYEFAELHKEYDILRQVIFETLESAGQLSVPARNAILDSIFNAVRDSGDAFSKEQLRKERESAKQLRTERDLREQFVATLTHDLRNPLTAIRAGVQILLRMGDDVSVRQKVLTRMVSSLDFAEKMIRDLLDANQIRVGKPLKLTIQEVDLCSVISNVLTELTSIHGDRFVFSNAGQLVGFWDPTNLARAIENLLSNAVKYGSQHAKIGICVSQCGSEVRIDINNKGNPITLEQQVHIFEPFYRSKSAEAAHNAGWGLGLPLVRGIAEAHHGRVEVRSNETEGTTFSIVLPRDSRQIMK